VTRLSLGVGKVDWTITFDFVVQVVAIELNMRNHLEYHKPYFNLPFWELGLLPG